MDASESSAKTTDKSKEAPSSKETFIVPVMELKDKFNRILRESFGGDPAFARVQNQSFEAALNSSRHTPEYLSLYIDDCLKRGLKGATEDQVELSIDRCVELFRLVSEKDVFERYYKQHLARRLLLGKSVSVLTGCCCYYLFWLHDKAVLQDYAERQVIANLKKECGYQFTSRLEGMFQDMRTSADTMAAFGRDPSSQNLPLDVSIQGFVCSLWWGLI